jgi:hypothetical protein
MDGAAAMTDRQRLALVELSVMLAVVIILVVR